jgi:predicted DNA-binding transcriptional regulator AlpA
MTIRQDTGSRPSTQNLPPRLWTHAETSEFLGLSPATLHDLNYKRTGPRSFKVGRHRRYDPRDVMAWLGERASDTGRDGFGVVVHNLPVPRSAGRGRF